MKNPICQECNLPRAPMGPAFLIAQTDYKMIQEFKLTWREMENMSRGKMALRHFSHKTWCEDMFISWLKN